MKLIQITPLALMLAAITACERTPVSGPPELRLGRVECVECGMLVSEDRCSTSILIEDRGRREYLFYDDIGCMLDHEHKGIDNAIIIERYVHDHTTRDWISADSASFLFTDPQRIYTPMGSGMIAFTTRQDADAARQKYQGSVLDYSQLAAARLTWKQNRHPAPCCREDEEPDDQ